MIKKMTMFIKRNLGSIFFYSFLGLILAFFLGWLPISPMVVASGSMEPTINIGDVVVVLKTDPNDLEVGDIIQFENDRYTVIHRIDDIQENDNHVMEYITKGDFNNAPDRDAVHEEQIDGRVIFIIPQIGKPSLYLRALLFGQ